MGIFNWSKTAGSNTTLEGISTGTGMAPNVFDNWVRAVSAALKSWQEDTGGALVSTGSSNAYVLATNSTLPSLADGQCLKFIANHANTGAATLNVDGLGAKAIRKGGDVALASGDIPSGMLCEVGYDASANGAAGAWLLVNPYPVAGYTAGGTDVAVADGGTGASTAAAARTNLGLVIGTDVQAQGATLASLEGLPLVAGDVLYATAADTLARLPKGTALQSLRMNAGATAPEWGTPGTWTLRDSATMSATSSVDFTDLGSPQDIIVTFRSVVRSTTLSVLLRASSDNGSSFYSASGDYYSSASSAATSADAGNGGTSSSAITSATVQILGFGSTAPVKTVYSSSSGASDTIARAEALNAIRILTSTGNFTSGTIEVWGR